MTITSVAVHRIIESTETSRPSPNIKSIPDLITASDNKLVSHIAESQSILHQMSLVNSEYTNKRSADQSTAAKMNTTSANTKASNPLGDLYHFPREIRDVIYRNVFPQYRVIYQPSGIKPYVMKQIGLERFHDSGHFDWTPCKLSVLRLSKAIKSEAMPIFYSKLTLRLLPRVRRRESPRGAYANA